MAYADEVLADSPLVYWRLDETSGATALDSSGNGRNGNHVGGVSLGGPSLLGDGSGRSASYDGVDDYTTVAYAIWMNTAHVTLTARIAPTAATLSGTSLLAGRWGDVLTDNMFLLYLVDGVPTGAISVGTGVQVSASGSAALAAGNTYTVALKYDGAQLKVFVDGVVVGVINESRALRTSNNVSTVFEIGRASRANNVNNWVGPVAEVAWYGTALPDVRLSEQHQAAIVAGIPTGALAPALPGLTTDISGTYVAPPPTGALAAILAPSASLVGAYIAAPVETSTTYANDGYNYGGIADVLDEPPVAAPPAHIRRVKVRRVHQSMPAPTLVNGRPT